MKFLFKLALRLFILLVVVVVVALLSWDWIVKKVAEHRITSATGMETRIGKLEVGVASPVIHIENFKLYNPAEFGGAPLVDIPEFHMEYDAAALAGGKLRVKLLRLNLAELNLVRNAAGQTNINILRDRLERQKAATTPTAGSGRADKSARHFEFEKIDMMNLTLGKVRYTDLAHPAASHEWNLDVHNQVFPNVKSQEDLYGMAFVLLLKCGPEMAEQLAFQLNNAAADGAQKMKQATDKARGLLK